MRRQSVQANLSVQALFGADDPEGTQLIADFNAYFGALEREASQLGSKLYQLIDQAMATVSSTPRKARLFRLPKSGCWT